MVNFPSFSRSFLAESYEWWDVLTSWSIGVLFDGKFNSLFSLLFAIGFSIQLDRLVQQETRRAAWIYARRLFALFAIGLLHVCLVWDGDVLHTYAVLGFLLLALRRVSDRTIRYLIALCLLYPGFRSLGLIFFASPDFTTDRLAAAEELAAATELAATTEAYVEFIRYNVGVLINNYTKPAGLDSVVLWYATLSATMLLGLLAGRRRWFQKLDRYKPVLPKIQWWSLGIGLACSATSVIVTQFFIEPFQPSPWFVVLRTTYAVSRVALMIFYVAVIIRISFNARWNCWLTPFAVAGRMPLTNYLMQSIVFTFIFYGWGLGLPRSSSSAIDFLSAFGFFFFVQVPLSALWLRRFRYGPMEYFWRVMTYGRPATGMIRVQPGET